MRYRLRHLTHYHYAEPVTRAHNQTRMLLRRDIPDQHTESRVLRIGPRPAYGKMHLDYFGNRVLYFEIDRPHTEFRILVRHTVQRRTPEPPPLEASAPWEQVAAQLASGQTAELRRLRLYTQPSRLAPVSAELAAFARRYFTPGTPLLVAADAMSCGIYRDFRFDPLVTSVTTPVTEVLARRRGVCQDFAQLMIAALRSIGLAARYVSGYLETLPPPGKPRLVGADASHAWVSLWCPNNGWQDFDPTNKLRPRDQHIVSAWGRDYDDVIPLNGVIEGGGERSTMRVAVDVMRLPDTDAEADAATPDAR